MAKGQRGTDVFCIRTRGKGMTKEVEGSRGNERVHRKRGVTKETKRQRGKGHSPISDGFTFFSIFAP